MTLLKTKAKILVLISLVFISVFSIWRSTGTAEAQDVALEPGDVSGFAWMGQNIVDGVATPQGGGGWLALNCRPSDCDSGNWGVKMDLDEGPNKGKFSGQAWSSNYGWLSFDESDVASCIGHAPGVSPNSVKADIIGGADEAVMAGWAKFVAGDAQTDGWDGCVAFDGSPFIRTYIDMTNGFIHGWAWGGAVVGWISFNNPECSYCNTAVVLAEVPQMTFSVTPSTIAPGGTATISWTSTSPAGNFVDVCEVYGNTSNYSHWKSTGLSTVTNVGEISVLEGNLPNGTHPVPAGIVMQTTTYDISCKDRFGVVLPTRYATLNVTGVCTNALANNIGQPLPCTFDAGLCTDPSADNVGGPLPCKYRACTDPTANNYTPPGPTIITDNTMCTYDSDPDPTRINLSVDPDTFYDNATDFDVNLSWVATDPVTSCVGRFTIEDGTPAWDDLAGWTFGVNLPEPNLSVLNWTQQNTAFNNLLTGVTGPMTYTFRITCQDSLGNDVSDTATVNLLPWTPIFEPPQVNLFIQSPNVDPVPNIQDTQDPQGFKKEIISSTAGYPAVVLRWQDLNTSTCSASSVMYDNATGTNIIGSNSDWSGEIVQDFDPTNNTMTLDITGPVVLHPTKFLITCVPDDPAFQPPNVSSLPTAWVCLGITGSPFPACSVSATAGGGVPTYIEI
jgi:hypothetical protein